MSINISNDYPTFKITDNLHQLVDRLGILTDAVDSNFRTVDSSLNDVLAVVHRDSALIQADNDLTITANNLTLQVDSDIISNCDEWNLTAQSQSTITSPRVVMSTDEVGLAPASGGNRWTTLTGDASGLNVYTGFPSTLSLSVTPEDITVPGTITMPFAGTGSPYTTAKTVSGAINELHDELVQITDVELERIVDLEALTSQHTTTLSSHTSTLESHNTRITTLEGLNIANRLRLIEGRLDDIETRLGLLGV